MHENNDQNNNILFQTDVTSPQWEPQHNPRKSRCRKLVIRDCLIYTINENVLLRFVKLYYLVK